MSARKPRGFTLIELLVVVVIIGVLIGLLIPAVISARESARRSTCTNNQHEIATALQQYEAASGRLPGYANVWGARQLSWIAMILPNLGINDEWKLLRGGNPPGSTSSDRRLLCPSDSEKPSRLTYPLSYVANCGWTDLTSFTTQQAVFTSTSASVKIKTDTIPDGATNTLMFTENVNATQWYPQTTAKGTGSPRAPSIADVGIVWQSQSTTPGWLGINQKIDEAPSFPTGTASTDLQYARPSSYHSGGVNATYCDGHVVFLPDTTELSVFQSMMSPNDRQARDTSFHTPALIP